MAKREAKTLYSEIKERRGTPRPFDEDKYCALILEIMLNPKKASYAAFCVEANISDNLFYKWIKTYEIFAECYAIGKMHARFAWEQEGERLKDEISLPGQVNLGFEHWKMKGWSSFGVGKTSRVRLDLNPHDSPDKHYAQLLEQASKGDFTAGEIKQLMEGVNVGLGVARQIAMQEEIDQLKKDLITMGKNSHVNNSIPASGATKKD